MSKRLSDFDERLYALVETALAEDLGEGDHSTLAVIPSDTRGKAVLKIKQEGVLAGERAEDWAPPPGPCPTTA